MQKEKSAGAIVFKKEKDREIKYLLLHYEEGHWDFPKGHIEAKEKEISAVLREIREETGITKVDILEGFKESITYFFNSNGKTINKEVVFYLAKSYISKVKLSFEHIGFIWLPYDKATIKLTYENSRDILKKANDFLRTNTSD
ncbi:NUDIX domain-containing protein [Candidatus Woesearchaeota archaeon]|nr:NUDIX domain-containing protein [Candidatus Woesearchaeota archaeon]